ncbi:MAG: M15 family metallopeptidase [Streptosporangiales bacterium]
MTDQRDESKRVPVWLVVVVALALIPASIMAMTLGALLGAVGGNDTGGAGSVRCKGIKAGKYASFYEQVLVGVKAPVTGSHITTLAAWHQAEGGSATWNPFNTTQPAPGATQYNSVGVKNYPSQQVGIRATIETLTNGNYSHILEALRAQSVDIHAVAGAVDGSVWGTKHMSDVTQSCTIIQAAGNVDMSGCPSLPGHTPWGGYANGEIPTNRPDMVPLPASMNGGWLRCDAGKSLIALSQAFKKHFGYPISVTDSYRTLAGQERLFIEKGPVLAATPGTSNHGWGCAVDLGSGINQFKSPTFNWMKRHAPKYGWVHPAWAESNPFEPWHWEYQKCSGATAA